VIVEAAIEPSARPKSSVAVAAAGVLGPALPISLLAAAQGGYFPTSWGWATLTFLWIVGVALVVGRVTLSIAERLFLVALFALTGWAALSTVWSAAPAETLVEVERMLVYVSGISAVLLVAQRIGVRSLLGGVFAAVLGVSAFALATRLFPERIGVFDSNAVYRLSEPIGYWNGLAVFAAIGMLLGLGFAARGQAILTRAASAFGLVLLLPTFYFTYGRAGWIALGLGLLVAILVDPKRLQLLATLLVAGPGPVAATWIASRQPGLTRAGSGLERAAHDGHRLALWLFAIGIATAAFVSLYAAAERRVAVARSAKFAFGAVVIVAAIIVGGFVVVRYGGPITITKRAYAAFKAPPPHVTNLNKRLLSFSGNGRADLWRLAWDDARNHLWLGSGPGTYERYFLAHQPKEVGLVRDAHGLYIETLAELGIIGLGLLLILVATPIVALRTARRHPLVPMAAGAYIAFLVHAGVDWDWELSAVTLVGLVCGAATLAGGHSIASARPISSRLRWGSVAAAASLAVAAAIGLVGNSALGASNSALKSGSWVRAAADARTAHRWMPWSPQPWAALGRAQLGAGLLVDARASFRKAISVDRGDWNLWYQLARASSGRARTTALRRAAALFPRSGLEGVR
jgi:O-Antigen ligase